MIEFIVAFITGLLITVLVIPWLGYAVHWYWDWCERVSIKKSPPDDMDILLGRYAKK